MTPVERAERALFGHERGTHYGDDERDLYAISRATLARAIEAAEQDAIKKCAARPPDFKQVFDFLDSIEGAGYGGMAEFEIARETMRRASEGKSE